MNDSVDVVVIGAGPAGASVALKLSEAWRVLLVDKREAPVNQIGESLIGAADSIISALGLLSKLKSGGHRISLGQASVWGREAADYRDSFLDPRGMGWRLDRPAFDRMLLQAAIDSGTRFLAPVQLLAIERASADASGWNVRIESAGEVQFVKCRFVVDATGRSASVGRAISGQRRVAADNLVCHYTRLRSSAVASDVENFSFVVSAPEGWWYLASLPSDEQIVAYHTDVPSARLSRTGDGFRSLLAQSKHLSARVKGAGFPAALAPKRASARSQWLNAPCGEGWCAVGDAAVAFDPLSSQGLFNALYTGLRGAEAIATWLDEGGGVGLQSYHQRIVAIRSAYANNLSLAYRLEQRYRENLFWQRRL
jgi:flavin-dependent dehydrogenase